MIKSRFNIVFLKDIASKIKSYPSINSRPKKEKNMPEEKNKKINKVIYSRWIKRGLNTFIPTDNSQILDEVDSGVYELKQSQEIGFYIFKKDILLDDLLEFPNSSHQEVLKGIKDFWERKDKFKEYGYTFKRGILLHGKPGSGKSCLINLAIQYIVEKMNGVVFTLNDTFSLNLYKKNIPEIFRIIEPNRPIIVIFEDLENFCHGEDESLLLNILDGIDQLENVIYIGSTNYIEKLKERIINRPNRFDRRIYIGMPSAEQRAFYFKKKLKKNDLKGIDLNKWVKDTEGMSVAHLGELIKSVIIFNNTYEEAIAILKDLQNFDKLHSSSYEKDRSNGFGFVHKESSFKVNLGNIDWNQIDEDAGYDIETEEEDEKDVYESYKKIKQ